MNIELPSGENATLRTFSFSLSVPASCHVATCQNLTSPHGLATASVLLSGEKASPVPYRPLILSSRIRRHDCVS